MSDKITIEIDYERKSVKVFGDNLVPVKTLGAKAVTTSGAFLISQIIIPSIGELLKNAPSTLEDMYLQFIKEDIGK